MKIIKIETCFDCPYYDNMSGNDEGQYGLCLKASDRYWDILPEIFVDKNIQKEYRALMHDPYDIPDWCPLDNV
jgi:hypothetical protein